MKTMRNMAGWMFGVVALFSTATAQANNWWSYSSALTGAPGGQVTATWNFDIGDNYPFNGANFSMEYDPASMGFLAEGSKVTVNGTEYGFLSVLADLSSLGGDMTSNVSPGTVAFAVYLPVLPELVSIPVTGPVTLSATFELASTFTGPAFIDFEGAVGGEEESLFSGSIQVTAVPEPETWLMWLGGLGLLAARYARRRQA